MEEDIKKELEEMKKLEETIDDLIKRINVERYNELRKEYYIPKSKVREILEKDIGQYMQFYRDIEELLQEGDK